MKKTIKSLMIALALTAVANGQRGLTLEDINHLYENAVIAQANDLRTKIVELQISYVNALNSHRSKLLMSRSQATLVALAALDAEVKNVAAANDGDLDPLIEGADTKVVSLRKIYEQQLDTLESKSDKLASALNETLIRQLEALKKSLVEKGKMGDALVIHKRLVELGVTDESEPTNDTDSITEECVVITKEYGGYASATSKQKLRLKEGAEYTLTLLIKLGDKKDLTQHDCLPRFFRKQGEKDFEGGNKNKLRRAQMASEERTLSNAGNGWSKLTVKFTHAFDELVVFGVVFYDTADIQIFMKDFNLTGVEGKNLITKDLNSSRDWEEGDHVSFTK